MRAYSMLRGEPHYRAAAFRTGLERCGYEVHGHPRETPNRDDVLVIWNRYASWARAADAFDRVGAAVLCVENGLLGRDWHRPATWYSIALDIPAGQGGYFPAGGPERFASWNVRFCDWRKDGKEVIVLAQRGIGPVGVAQPQGWHYRIAAQLRQMQSRPVRIREHPGENAAVPIEDDLEHAYCCVTWGSGAAFKALIRGVPVFFGSDKWPGAGAAQKLGKSIDYPYLQAREPMFERLAWSTWNIEEIASGLPLKRLLDASRSMKSPGTTAPA